jgi:hypothetical protein
MSDLTFDRLNLAKDLFLDASVLDRLRLWGLSIAGMEVTQAIQYYQASRHLTDPADRGADNAVTLIAGKPAWVRVYVRSGIYAQITNVTGTLELSRRALGFLYQPVDTLSPQPPGTVTARRNPDYAVERGTLTASLNFIIPADMMCGALRLRAVLTAPGGHSAELTIYLNVTLRQTLRLAGIMVGYNGPASTAAGAPNLTLAAPTLADLQTTSAWTLRTFPVRSLATYRSAGTVTWNLPLTDAPSCQGCCTPNWVALNAAVQTQRVADGNRTDVLYYGLMAVGIPMGPVIGCNTGGVSTGASGNGVTMAHELGHACGLPHAPCGTPGDPNYPAYEPYDPANTPQASIGEYGLDIDNGNIFSPAMFKDLMSYCAPRWISLYNYGRLSNNANLAPVSVCVDYPWWRDYVLYDRLLIPELWLPDPPPDVIGRMPVINPEPLISIIGVVHGENEVEIKSIMRLEAQREVVNGVRTDLVAELVGREGKPVASAPVFRLPSHGMSGCGCGGDHEGAASYPYTFQAFLTNAEAGLQLRLRRADKEVWSRSAPKTEPQAPTFRARLAGEGKKEATQLQVEWKTRPAGDQDSEGWLQWSADQGRTWNALMTGLQGGQALVDGSSLPAGRIQLRLLVSDGFHTAVSKTVSVTMPRRPPAVSIMSPLDGQTFVAGYPLRLWGAVASSEEAAAGEIDSRWLLDGKEVAKGLDAFITAPEAGEHRLSLSVKADGQARVTVGFRTIKVPLEPG